MKPINAKRERGAALLALLAVIMLGASWFLVSQLNAESGMASAVRKARNAEVLNRAKQALIGYVAMQAAEAGGKNPGRLPCPEAVNNIGTTSEGISAPWVGPPNTSTCSSIGRLPWRTLGLDKLADSAGEPLWYVVGPSWRLTNSTSTLVINSNTLGDITVDGQQTVALIVAPGPAMNVQAGAGCTARNQTRSAPSPTMGARDYIECFDSSTLPLQFVTTASSTSFNDQVVRITVADIMPGIEAAIAKRIEREIVPALNAVYTSSAYGFSGSKPVYPYAVPWVNGVTNPGPSTILPSTPASSFLGVAGIYQGLLPFNQTGCTAAASNPRCLPTLITWQGTPADAVEVYGYGYIGPGLQTCSWQSGGEVRECLGEYHEHDALPPRNTPPIADPSLAIRIEMTATLNNVAMGLRAIDTTKMTVEARDDVALGLWQPQAVTYTAKMNDGSVVGKPVGSVTLTFGATLPNIDVMGWGTYAQFRIRLDRTVMADHALLDTTNATTGWFARNEWYRLAYYAVAQGHTAGTLPPSCMTAGGVPATACLSVANVTLAGAQRAILILSGRSVNGTSRPSATLADYLESGNATGAFTRNTISSSAAIPAAQRFNDRVVVVGSN